ncbi:MAG: hypothetical protein IJ589_09950 [Lachnospiraceae bacterium]|nr:hypothetical protein [Lachnospiraceae bacterium]
MNTIVNTLKKPSIQYLILFPEIAVLTAILISLTYGTGVAWDEAYTWHLSAEHSFSEIVELTAADVHPPLYYFIGKISLGIFGRTLHVLSMTSVFPTVILMILSAVLIRKRWGLMVSFLFNLSIALAPLLSYYNVESRMYSWMDFFVLSGLIFGRECLELELSKKSLLYWILFYLAGVGAVYTQYFGVLPIVVCYFWMGLTFLFRKEFKKILSLLACAFLSIIGYLPWMGVLLKTYGTKGDTQNYEMSFSLLKFFEENYETNLMFSGITALILLAAAVILFLIFIKRFEKNEISFLFMLIFNVIFCLITAQLIGAGNGHFFSSRYILYILPMFWLFESTVFAKLDLKIAGLFLIWTTVLCASSYVGTYDYRYNMTPLMDKTVAFTDANIEEGAVIVYDFQTFDTVYSYYLPGHEFIYIDDLDINALRGQTFWIIRMGEERFSEEEQEAYNMKTEVYERFGYMGMERFALEKVMVAP